MREFNLEEWKNNQSIKLKSRAGREARIVNVIDDCTFLGEVKLIDGISWGQFEYYNDGRFSKLFNTDVDILFDEESPKFKVGDRIKYKGYLYRIANVTNNFYDVDAIPPYDTDGVVTSIGVASEKDIMLAPEPKLTEFERWLKMIVDTYYQRPFEPANTEIMTPEGAINHGQKLLAIAKKELMNELPKWKRLPFSDVCYTIDSFGFIEVDGVQSIHIGNKYIPLNELEKLDSE